FMGDTGSQELGAGITGIALLYGAPWLILFIGVVYMAESLSVIIQVAYFKRTGGRRIFRMSPIHHHFELGGWTEKKIVHVFSAVTLAGSAVGLRLLL
ncbi:MAG: phospho-N-acetylmuramoyl-pentapeptide-transferase, partial [Ruminococcaceae bacterium]|nr:phospho-N-acetylmuramoyl-pentapeptide-transferase [Oscillospiraceae bacterium]